MRPLYKSYLVRTELCNHVFPTPDIIVSLSFSMRIERVMGTRIGLSTLTKVIKNYETYKTN